MNRKCVARRLCKLGNTRSGGALASKNFPGRHASPKTCAGALPAGLASLARPKHRAFQHVCVDHGSLHLYVYVRYQAPFVLGAYLQEWGFLENGPGYPGFMNLLCLVPHGILTTLAPRLPHRQRLPESRVVKGNSCTYLSL